MEENDSIDLRKYLAMAKRKWYWYAIAFVVFISLAITYHFYRMDQHMAYAQMLVEDDEGSGGSAASALKAAGGMASIMRTFNVGGLGSASVDNELLIMQSHNVLIRTIKRLGINRLYFERDGIKRVNLYKDSPIAIVCNDSILDTLRVGFKVKVDIHKDGTVNATATKGLLGKVIGEVNNASLPTLLKTPYGDFHIIKTSEFTPGSERNITALVSGNELTAKSFTKLLDIDYSSKKGDAIALEFKTTNTDMGKDMLNSMMAVYNEIRLNRKNDKAAQAIEFYDKQIAELTESLSESEQQLVDFQNKTKIVSPKDEVIYMYTSDKEAELEMLALENKISALNLILNIASDPAKKYDLLPSVGDSISTVGQYNALILKKQQLETSATSNNAALSQITDQIDALRGLMVKNVELVKQNTQNTIASIKNYNNKNVSRLSQVPDYQREYINLMRDKELKNDLYVFLLEKRYNNAMTLAMNFPRGFIIDPAYCDIKPIMTKTYIAIGACLFLALVIPTVMVCIAANRKPKEDTVEDEE